MWESEGSPALCRISLFMDRALSDHPPARVYVDISWDETAKYITATPETVDATASLIKRYPDRFLFGSDVVAPTSIEAPSKVYVRAWKRANNEVSGQDRICLTSICSTRSSSCLRTADHS